MPIYRHQCRKGHKFDVYRPLARYDEEGVCECGEKSVRITVPTMIAPDLQESYVSPASGKVISSYRQRREDMKRTGCVDYEPSLKNNLKQRHAELDAEVDRKIEKTVESEIEKMSGDKREMLGKSLETSEVKLERT